jgi:type IV secretion system protein VirD4
MHRNPADQVTDNILIALAAAIGLSSLSVWAAGEALSVLLTGHPTGLGVAQAFGLTFDVATNLDDPAAAWEVRHVSLGAPRLLLWIVGALFLIVGVWMATKLWRWVRGASGDAPTTREASQWASNGDLKPLIVREPQPRRLTLGRSGGRLLAAEERQSTLVVGPTQAGKTSALVIGAILEWQGPVLCTSVKTDFLANTIEARKKLGRVMIYDPAEVTGLPGNCWSPLNRATDWSGAWQTAKALVASSTDGGDSGIKDAHFWHAAAEKLLAPILYAAELDGRTIAEVAAWIDDPDETEILEILSRSNDSTLARQNFLAHCSREPQMKSSIHATAANALIAYQDEKVLRSARERDITPDKLLDGGWNTAYLCAPHHEQKRLKPLFATLIEEHIQAVNEYTTITNKPIDPPLLVVLDEAANIAPLDDLDIYASTAAGLGIQLVSVFQNISQIESRWGERKAQTIVNNHRAGLFLAGQKDTRTLRYVSEVTGETEVSMTSKTDGHLGRDSTTQSKQFRTLAPANVVREQKPGEAILIYGHLKPARLKLRYWFKDRRLQRLASGEDCLQVTDERTALEKVKERVAG